MATAANDTDPPPIDRVSAALDAIDRLLKIYFLERYVYLAGAAAGMALLIYAAFLTIRSGGADKDALGYFFGAGGAFSVAGGLTLRMLNKSFALIREMLNARSGAGT